MNLQSTYHININCTDFERSYAFHKKLVELLSAPAAIIEEIIIKDLFKSLDLLYPLSTGTFDFRRYAESARAVYMSREAKRNG